ncbi:beta-phosphoglucomutase [uncultured Rikenella sp.]|uniref:beta-phosphoglucomutase n=1 Tax=uncultured Rikenella sp. TaxID=368003 RepID=UPI00260FC788|nr:beta-phosphoglucomutase [uncultured Rikenella sp.]
MICAAIFDMDGVIVDTAKYHYQAWRRLAAELGFEFTEADNERLKGVSRMQSLEILLEVGGFGGSAFTEGRKEEMAAQKNEWYVEYISRMTPDEILPGVLSFLEQVRAAGVRTALGSASRNTGIILDRLKIRDLFDTVVDGTMVTRTKPDPEVFLKCASLLGGDLFPTQCVVFEDAAAGIEAARAGGMYSVGIGNPDILREADFVIPGFAGISWWEIEKRLSIKANE